MDQQMYMMTENPRFSSGALWRLDGAHDGDGGGYVLINKVFANGNVIAQTSIGLMIYNEQLLNDGYWYQGNVMQVLDTMLRWLCGTYRSHRERGDHHLDINSRYGKMGIPDPVLHRGEHGFPGKKELESLSGYLAVNLPADVWVRKDHAIGWTFMAVLYRPAEPPWALLIHHVAVEMEMERIDPGLPPHLKRAQAIRSLIIRFSKEYAENTERAKQRTEHSHGR